MKLQLMVATMVLGLAQYASAGTACSVMGNDGTGSYNQAIAHGEFPIDEVGQNAVVHTFDDGSVFVAGRAEHGLVVSIQKDGKYQGFATGDGKWVGMMSLLPQDVFVACASF